MISTMTTKRIAFFLGVFFCHWLAISVSAYPLTDAQKGRLGKLIPRTFAKLQNQEPVLIVTLGDSVTEMFTPDAKTNHNYLNAYHAKFADLLCREFFYPGGVRILNPEKGKPAKADQYLGNEIIIENLGLGGRTSVDAIQRITTDAFLNDPDLIIIQYGINDALRGLSYDVYRRSIQLCIDECRRRGVDVILMAPTMVRISSGPLKWGLARGYATVARELALKNGVFFMDAGQVISRTNGLDEENGEMEAKEAIAVVADKIGEKFEFPGLPKEALHPNLQAHLEIGKALYDELFNGEPSAPFRAQAKVVFDSPDTVEAQVTLKNGSKETKRGYLGALSVRRVLLPTEDSAYQAFQIEPGKSVTLSFTYKRQKNSPGGEAKPRLMSLDPGDPRVFLSFLVADAKSSRVLDLAPSLEPVGVTWKEGLKVGVKDGIRLDWRFVNAGKQAVSGSYEIKMGGRKASGNFDLQSDNQKDFFAEFPISEKAEVIRFKETVELQVKVAGKAFVFFREIEAVQDLYLGEKVALGHDIGYTAGKRGLKVDPAAKEAIYLRADADQDALYLTFDLEGIQLLKIPSGVSMVAELALDGRPQKENRQFGFVDNLQISFGNGDGQGAVSSPRVGIFGNSYDQLIDPVGIGNVLKTEGDSSRKIEIRVPRIYLYRHEWKLGEPGQVLGLYAGVSLGAVGPDPSRPTNFPADRRWVLANPDLYYRDARSLITLHLGKRVDAVPTWSVRLY